MKLIHKVWWVRSSGYTSLLRSQMHIQRVITQKLISSRDLLFAGALTEYS